MISYGRGAPLKGRWPDLKATASAADPWGEDFLGVEVLVAIFGIVSKDSVVCFSSICVCLPCCFCLGRERCLVQAEVVFAQFGAKLGTVLLFLFAARSACAVEFSNGAFL